MTNFIHLLKVSLILLCSALFVQAETNWHTRVERWLSHPMEIDIRTLTADDKIKVIAELRAFGGHRATLQLLRLGDEQTIVEVMRDAGGNDRAKSEDALGLLQNVRVPLIIPALAELLYLTEKAEWVRPRGEEADVGQYTRPMHAAVMIQDILLNTSRFSPEVKKWVSSVPELDGEAFRYAFRQWWEQNKEAFARKDYTAVQPLKPVAAPALSVVTSQVSSSVAAAPTNAVALPVKSLSPTAKQPKPTRWPLLVGIGAVALIAVVLVALRKQKK